MAPATPPSFFSHSGPKRNQHGTWMMSKLVEAPTSFEKCLQLLARPRCKNNSTADQRCRHLATDALFEGQSCTSISKSNAVILLSEESWGIGSRNIKNQKAIRRIPQNKNDSCSWAALGLPIVQTLWNPFNQNNRLLIFLWVTRRRVWLLHGPHGTATWTVEGRLQKCYGKSIKVMWCVDCVDEVCSKRPNPTCSPMQTIWWKHLKTMFNNHVSIILWGCSGWTFWEVFDFHIWGQAPIRVRNRVRARSVPWETNDCGDL